MRQLLLCLVLTLTTISAAMAAPDPNAAAETAYQAARQCYYGLRTDATRGRQREAWEGCQRKFQQVVHTHPKSPRAADAGFTAAKISEELFQISKNREDLKAARDGYLRVAKRYRSTRLADDALYRAGIVAWEGFHKRSEARRHWWQVAHWHRDGDKAAGAQRLMAQLDAIEAKQFRSLAPLLVPDGPDPLATPKGAATPATASRVATVPATTTPPTPTAPEPSTATSPTPAATQRYHIVIDAGHGGKDPGAHGPNGTLEKDVTLAMAKQLGAALKKALPCTVTFTRTSDRYLTLEERNRVANQRRADLFISVHANAATNAAARGIQTYYLNNASDEASRRLAARENAAITGSSGAVPELEQIISTMLQNAFTEESRDLARDVQRHLVSGLKAKYTDIEDHGVRSALFYVLVGAKSPSILVETSFISHPKEEQRLRDPTYQSTLTTALAAGITHYLTNQHTKPTL